jgi:hypothetical protein
MAEPDLYHRQVGAENGIRKAFKIADNSTEANKPAGHPFISPPTQGDQHVRTQEIGALQPHLFMPTGG